MNVSGASQALASGAISGRKLMGSDPMALLSGNIIETSGGTYRANLYDWDTSGNQIGYFFSASGCLPIMINVVTIDSTSGKVWIASGANTVVPPATLSGVVANSGLFVTATATVASGALYLASGSLFRNTFASGVLAASGGFPTAWGNSGNTLPASGVNVTVPTASISGVVANSGLFVQIPIATLSGVVANSGLFVTATATVASGALYLASGSIFKATFASGVFGTSGGFTTAWGSSGQALAASGSNVVVPTASLSGVVANSGLFVTATATVASGALYLASGSIFRETLASGVLAASGGLVTAWGNSGQAVVASGAFVVATASVASGSLYLASGSIFRETLASGVLAASGGFPTSWGNSGQVISASGAYTNANLVFVNGTAVTSGGDDVLYIGTAQAGTANTVTLDAGAPASGNVFKYNTIGITAGTGALQGNRTIIGYSGTNKVATVFPPWEMAPASDSAFVISCGGGFVADYLASGVWGALRSTQTAAGTFGQGVTSVQGNVTGTVAGIDDDGITPGSFLPGAITATAIAANAITADKVADGTIDAATFASGATIPQSGFVYLASGSTAGGAASGLFVTVPIATISGTSVVATTASGSLYLASGSLFRNTFASGTLAASGGIPTAWGNSGQVLPASGANITVLPASISGTNVIVPPATLSGVVPASGGFVQIPIASLSGVVANSGIFVTVPKATISGVIANSGIFASVPTATLSGIVPLSGQVFIGSGMGSTAVVDSGSISQIAATLLTIDVSGAIEANAAKQSLATTILKQTGRFNTLASGLVSGVAVTYLCDGITPKIIQPVTTTRSGRPISELGVGQ